jgi:segregation and condensation protein A
MDTVSESQPRGAYLVRSGTFEGPLEHLLTLVESRKLFINEVSLAQVTNDYLAYIKTLPKYHMEELTGFIIVAATLILIKSRSLLPGLELTPEEKENITDLETRLIMYQKAKEVGETLKKIYGKKKIHLGVRRLGSHPIWSPDKNVEKNILYNIARELLQKLPVESEPAPEVKIRKVMSIDEMIASLTDRITSHMSMSFREFSKHPDPEDARHQKVHTIVSFLALLELVREGILDALQDNPDSDITISKLTNEATV